MYVYGPVPSRRLGRSLGVSPIPAKVCSYTCVYCQLGRTTTLQVKRESFFDRAEIMGEIAAKAKTAKPDFVTFVGDGEPTLCKDLGWLLKQTREKLALPTAVITNGSLLSLEDVRRDLMEADVVIPTFDAGSTEVFRKMNRPHRHVEYDAMLQGLIDFSAEFKGRLWLEVMLVRGVNDSDAELKAIKAGIDRIGPERVYVLTPVRPPAESWVEPPPPETILRAQELLGDATPVALPEAGEFGLEGFAKAEDAIMEIGSRHPLRKEQALEIAASYDAPGTVENMIADGQLVETPYEGRIYLLPRHFMRR